MVFFFQLPVHPVNDEFIQYILSLAFKHFKQRDSYASSPAATNGEYVAALYAEVLGTLAHACFLPVRKRFTAEFKEHQNNPSSFVNITTFLKFEEINFARLENKILVPWSGIYRKENKTSLKRDEILRVV